MFFRLIILFIVCSFFSVNIDDAEAVTNRITFNTQLKPVDDKNLLIIEAIPEIMDAKQKLFKDLWLVLLLFRLI